MAKRLFRSETICTVFFARCEEMFDLRTKVMIGIASTLLIAAVMLITVVLCLYLKISKALK